MIVSCGISFHLFSFVPFPTMLDQKSEQNVDCSWGHSSSNDWVDECDTSMDLGWFLKVWSTIDKEVNAIPFG